jgi:hypothetical protein
MRAFACVIMVASYLAAPAGAAAAACSGSAKGANGAEVTVSLEPSNGGAAITAVWQPPSDQSDPFPTMDIGDQATDQGLGPARFVRVGTYARMQPKPKSKHAEVSFTLDGGASWGRPWGMYPQLKRQNARSVSIWGSVPIAIDASVAAPLNPDLLTAIGPARRVEVRVEGDAGEVFGARTFDLGATAQRDALFRQALGEASEAAAGNCKEGR